MCEFQRLRRIPAASFKAKRMRISRKYVSFCGHVADAVCAPLIPRVYLEPQVLKLRILLGLEARHIVLPVA